MPEGDTLYRTAQTLRGALLGRAVTLFRTPLTVVDNAARRYRVVGSNVSAVESRGKHLLIQFSTGATLRTHLQMSGSWHVYRAGSRWLKPSRLARVVLGTETAVAVCFSAPTVELVATGASDSVPALNHLGPDVLAVDFDAAIALRNLRARADEPIAVALLNQSALAGIGNVYKSEILFIRRISPFVAVRDLSDDELLGIIETARTQMKRNLGSDMRRTTTAAEPQRLWVYGNSGMPCRRCGTTIQRIRQGHQGRSTYWCPPCQPSPQASPRSSDGRGGGSRDSARRIGR